MAEPTLNTRCPECGEVFKEGPQPDNFVCGSCAFRLSLQAITRENVNRQLAGMYTVPIAPIVQKVPDEK